MKHQRALAATSAFVLAIAGAFVTKAENTNKKVTLTGYTKLGEDCNTTRQCTTTTKTNGLCRVKPAAVTFFFNHTFENAVDCNPQVLYTKN